MSTKADRLKTILGSSEINEDAGILAYVKDDNTAMRNLTQ